MFFTPYRVHENVGPSSFVSHSTDAEHAHELFEYPPAAPVLRHLKCRDDLYASSSPHMWIRVDRDGEATFSINEPLTHMGSSSVRSSSPPRVSC